jgi:Winged helix-turn helix
MFEQGVSPVQVARELRAAVPRPAYAARGGVLGLHRLGFSPQVPAHRAAERDEAAIAAWRAQTWAKVRG